MILRKEILKEGEKPNCKKGYLYEGGYVFVEDKTGCYEREFSFYFHALIALPVWLAKFLIRRSLIRESCLSSGICVELTWLRRINKKGKNKVIFDYYLESFKPRQNYKLPTGAPFYAELPLTVLF